MKIFKIYILLLTTSIVINLLISACTSGKKIINNPSYHNNIYELYLRVNNLDSNTIKYHKNNRLTDLLISAKENEELENYYAAIIDLLEAYRYDTSKVILFAIARNFFYIERNTLAFDYAFQSYLLDTNFIPTIELLARILYAKEHYDLAVYFSQKLITLNNNNLSIDEIDLHLSILEKFDTTYAKCIDFLKSFKQPTLDLDVKLGLAYYYIQKHDTTEVVKILDEFFDNPDYFKELKFSHFSYYFKALLDLGELEKAIRRFCLLTKKLSLSDVLFLTDIFSENFDATKRSHVEFMKNLAITLDSLYPSYYHFKFKQLEIYKKLNDTTNVYKLCKNILSFENIDVETLIKTTSILFFDLNKKDEALKYYQTFKLTFSEQPNYFSFLGFCYLNNKQYNLAKEAYTRALALDSNNYQTYGEMGYLYAVFEDWAKSDSFYLKSLEIFPNNPIVLNNFAYSLIQRDTNLTYASLLIERALKLRSEDPNLLDTYGWYFYKIKDFQKAKELIQKSIEIDATRAEPFLHLSMIFKALGDEINHKTFLEKAISIDPNNKEVLDYLKEMDKTK